MGAGTGIGIRRTDERRKLVKRTRRTAFVRAGFFAHVRSPFGRAAFVLYTAAAVLLLQRGIAAPISALALAAAWRWGFALGAVGAAHAYFVSAEPVIAGVALLASVAGALATVDTVRKESRRVPRNTQNNTSITRSCD